MSDLVIYYFIQIKLLATWKLKEKKHTAYIYSRFIEWVIDYFFFVYTLSNQGLVPEDNSFRVRKKNRI